MVICVLDDILSCCVHLLIRLITLLRFYDAITQPAFRGAKFNQPRHQRLDQLLHCLPENTQNNPRKNTISSSLVLSFVLLPSTKFDFWIMLGFAPFFRLVFRVDFGPDTGCCGGLCCESSFESCPVQMIEAVSAWSHQAWGEHSFVMKEFTKYLIFLLLNTWMIWHHVLTTHFRPLKVTDSFQDQFWLLRFMLVLFYAGKRWVAFNVVTPAVMLRA